MTAKENTSKDNRIEFAKLGGGGKLKRSYQDVAKIQKISQVVVDSLLLLPVFNILKTLQYKSRLKYITDVYVINW